MDPRDLARALLRAESAQDRQALLSPQEEDFYVQVVGMLKDEVDRERLRDSRAACRAADIAAEVADFAATQRCQALAAWARGNALFHLGDFAESLQLYRQAAVACEAEGMEVEAARLATNQAYALKNLGQYDQGLQAVETALAILRRHPGSPFLPSVLMCKGTLCRLARRLEPGLAALLESEQLYASMGQELEWARARINRANVLENLDRFAEAIALLEEARAVLLAQECALEVARADLNLGITLARLDRYDEAIAAFGRAEDGFRRLGNDMEVAVVELYRADLYAHFHLDEALLQTLDRDYRTFDERQMQAQAARTLLYRAAAYRRLGDLVQAEPLLVRAQESYRRMGDAVGVQWAALERATLWHKVGESARALPAAMEAAALLRDRGMPVRSAAASLLAAHCQLALGQPTAAAGQYEAVLRLADMLEVPSLRYQAQHGLGRVATQQGRLEEAAGHLRLAIGAIQDLRQRLPVEEFRTGFLEDKLQVYQDAVLLCLQLNHLEEAFGYVEQAKSSTLVDLMISRLARQDPGTASPSGDLAVRLRTLEEKLTWHYRKLETPDEEGRGGEAGARTESTTWSDIRAVEQEIIQTWQRMQETQPLFAAPGHPEPSTFAATQAQLEPQQVLVQYYIAGDSLHAFVVGPEGFRGHGRLTATPAQVDDALAALATVLSSVPHASPAYVGSSLEGLARQQLGWLYDDLLRPLERYLAGAARLLIIPDGALFAVPFHALYDGQQHLLERCESTYAPSIQALRLCQDAYRRRAGAPERSLAIGYSCAGALPHVHRETAAFIRAFPEAAVLTDDQATLANFHQHASRSTLLHIATHAVFRRDNPLFSALQMAGPDWLRVWDLAGMQLNSPLVILSACETGRHHLRGGDLLGLTRAFICAGAAAVLGSLWTADDESTAMLMEHFYHHLAGGENAPAALREAQLAVRAWEQPGAEETTHPYAHPFYWAPFYLLGSPSIRWG